MCAAENRWAEAKRTLGDYVRRFPGKLGLELNYARALIKTVALAEAVSFLETLNALPSELGEKPGTLYQEALGALADAALGRGDRVAASAYVQKALAVPERLEKGEEIQRRSRNRFVASPRPGVSEGRIAGTCRRLALA